MKLPYLYRTVCCGRHLEAHQVIFQPLPGCWPSQAVHTCHPLHGCNAEVTR